MLEAFITLLASQVLAPGRSRTWSVRAEKYCRNEEFIWKLDKITVQSTKLFFKEYLMNSIEVPVLSNRDQQNNGSLSTSPLFDVTTGQSREAMKN